MSTAAVSPARAWEMAKAEPRWIVAVLLVLIQSFSLFNHLGTYATWDDEANTGLFAEGVWRTGDTTAVIGHNIVAYRSGLELTGTKNRLTSPLPYFVDAPFQGILGQTPLAARLPFALFGLGAVCFALWWLKKKNAPLSTWILIAAGVVGNVSFALYTRQGRYYGMSTFFTLLVTYLYLNQDGSWKKAIGLGAAATALLATHYIAFAALGLALGADYLAFGWRKNWIPLRKLGAALGIVALVGGLIVFTWYPFGKPFTGYVPVSWLADRTTLWWWNIRDFNACEFGASILLLAGPLIYFLGGRQNLWLVRIPFAFAFYNVGVCIGSPQPVGQANVADIRYMQAAMPAIIFLAACVLQTLPAWPRYLAAFFLFFTNAVEVGTAGLVGQGAPPLRSTFKSWVNELRTMAPTPYGAAVEWVHANVPEGKSIWVAPDYATYPLMYQSPQAVYAWQFHQSARAEYAFLPAIHFEGAEPPDYVIAFGGEVWRARGVIQQYAARGVHYEERVHLPVHWPDLTRPELFWRSFEPVPAGDPSGDGVFIFQRQ